MKAPIRIGIVGMGGFAASHHHAIARLEDRGVAQLICTCDPQLDSFIGEQTAWRLATRGVRVFHDYRTMLEACHRDLDVVVLPTPIQLHAEMHAAVTSFGLPTYLEKPPTLDYAELDRMIGADARARKATQVGFNFIIEKLRLTLKERLLNGEFGAIRGATLNARWPRPASYFHRNNWAGRLLIDDKVVLDSCFGNAMGHFVHNLLFWTGTGELFSWAQIAAVRAELYRAHAIEGADTFLVETDTTAGITMRFALSHVGSGPSTHSEIVLCDKATLRYTVGGAIDIRWLDGRTETYQLEPYDPLMENHLHFFRYLRGEISRPATTLAESRPLVTLNDLAYISSGRITPIPASKIAAVRDEKEQKDYISVTDMKPVFDNFLVRGLWPGPTVWGREPGEVVTPADLARLHDIVRAMAKG